MVGEDFVQLSQVDPTIQQEIRYDSDENFVGRPIDGYFNSECWLTIEAAEALSRVQAELATMGLGLKVFDGYRPQRAVDEFFAWSRDRADQGRKTQYYPAEDKRELFSKGYIARRSGHSRGSTVDLTIIAEDDDSFGAEPELNMGTCFDLFDAQAHTHNRALPAQVRANRLLLTCVMRNQGFSNYPREWWHFTLTDEPYPDTYFDFPVT